MFESEIDALPHGTVRCCFGKTCTKDVYARACVRRRSDGYLAVGVAYVNSINDDVAGEFDTAEQAREWFEKNAVPEKE